MAKVLSQDEVDAVLNAVTDESLKKIRDNLNSLDSEPNIQPYDLTNQDRVIRGRMPILEIIYERFIRQLRVSLSNSLRKVTTISMISTDLLRFGEFVNTLPIPSCMTIMRFNELRGPALLVFESKLAYGFIDAFFGGVNRPFSNLKGKEFTSIELSFMRRIMDFVINDLEDAWAPVHRIDAQYVRTEINPQFVGVVPPSDIVIATTFEIEFENYAGTLMVVLPYSTIEPIKAKLSSSFQPDRDVVDTQWIRTIQKITKDIPVKITAVLEGKDLTLNEVQSLEVGQVIQLKNSDEIDVGLLIDGKKLLSGGVKDISTNNQIILKERK